VTFQGQLPPHDIAAEEAMIGSVLIDGQCIGDVIDMVRPADFYHEIHGTIYRCMVALNARNEAINQITVSQELQRLKKLDDCGGVSYLSHLISVVPSPLDVVDYATIVRRTAFYRKLLEASTEISKLAMNASPNTQAAIDKCQSMLEELNQSAVLQSRRLLFGIPKLIQTNPPRYIWEINEKEMRFTLGEITSWLRFKNRVISELNFVPIRPQDWDGTINELLAKSIMIEAPSDASEEQQLKILIQTWFTRMREATIYSELAVGRHIIREYKGESFYFFKSTPLLNHLKKEWKRGVNSEDLWVYCHKWGGVKRKHRVKSNAESGSTPVDLWGIPMVFAESDDDRAQEKQPELIPQDVQVTPEPVIEPDGIEMPEEF
jgi:hypothetical protein